MSAYIAIADIQGQISPADLAAAFNDDNSGTPSAVTLQSIITSASAQVDSYLSAVYQLPFNPVPQTVFNATLNIACYAIYRRAKASPEINPFTQEYTRTMQWLKETSESTKVGFDQTVYRAVPPVAIFSECLSTWGSSA